ETTTLFAVTAGQGTLPIPDLTQAGLRMALALGGPLLAVATVTAVLAGVGQVGFKPTPKAAKPKLSHLSPKRGLQRLKPATAGWEFVRSAGKVGLLVAVVWGPMRDWGNEFAQGRNIDEGL